VRERTSELEAANADKDRMLTLLGHDLRSPLTALTQTAEQMRGGSRAPIEVEPAVPVSHFASDVAEAGRQMLLMIEDIVLWSRLRVGASPARGVHEANAIVDPAVRLHSALAVRRGVKIAVDVAADLAVQADLVLAQALARNLVGNAVKFARGRVEVTARHCEAGVVFAVRDDGEGLPADVRDRLKGHRTGEERGFGLRLCQEIAATLGVAIEALAPEEGGTEMRVTLPAASSVTVEARP
jgi:signal transduction histidine kinase